MVSTGHEWISVLFDLLNVAIPLLGILWAKKRLTKGVWTLKISVSRR
jgi:hypothetical protein